MQLWDTIINTAMMGTDKKQLSAADIPVSLETASVLINENTAKDKEEKFLQLASLIFNFRQCGVLPAQKEIMMPPAPGEEKQYCNAAATQVLKDILSEENIPLLKFWLQHCHQKQQVSHPEIIPVLLTSGVQQKKLQWLIADCCGKRGEWLASFNAAWNFSSTQSDEERWQTGTFEQRKEILKQKRRTDPSKAREWVEQTWLQEDANTKTAFLELFSEDTSGDDIPFLESLATEKSKKVKEAAMQLLKQIPGSAIVSAYENLLCGSVVIKKEKALLGMVNKTVLKFKLPEIVDESIYKTGVDKLSSTKEITDDEYVIFQLTQCVPPFFWEKHFGADPENVIDLLQKDAIGKKMIPALVNAITRFNDTRWALNFMRHSSVFYIDIIPLLQALEQEAYSIKFFDKFPNEIIAYATKRETEWSTELTRNIFRHTAKNPYQYNRNFYSQHIHLIPMHIVGELEKCTPPEEHFRTMWSNTSDYIIKLITLKIQTRNAFNE